MPHLRTPLCNRDQLLRLAAQNTASSPDVAEIQRLCSLQLDWDSFLDCAREHGVLPIVARTLLNANANLPKPIAEQLTHLRRTYQLAALRSLSDLTQILDALRAASIPALPFKGASLSQLIFNDATLRPFGDHDLLVRPSDVEETARILQSLGYEGLPGSASFAEHFAGEHEHEFNHPSGMTPIDLHWELSTGCLPFKESFEALHARAATTHISGHATRTLGLEDLLIYLCLHATKHGWGRLAWVSDIAELVRTQATLDLGVALRRADAMGYRRVILVSLSLAQSVYQLSLPPAIVDAIDRDRHVSRLSEQLKVALFNPPAADETSAAGLSRFHLRMLNRWRDKLRYLLAAAAPNLRDRGALVLPTSLRWGYFFVRPIRLIGRRMAAAANFV